MTAAKMSSKGQITIPLSVRKAMKIRQGDHVEFVEIAPGRFELMPRTRSITDLKGMFKADRTISIEEMNETIARMGAMAGRIEP